MGEVDGWVGGEGRRQRINIGSARTHGINSQPQQAYTMLEQSGVDDG